MKKGKNVRLHLSDCLKSVYGTVDSKNLKSVYINIQSWACPKTDSDNWNRVVCNLSRQLKHTVFESVDTKIFSQNTIVDLDLRSSGIGVGKKSFFNLEINLYIDSPLDFKSQDIKDSIRSIISNIYKSNISNNNFFDFTLTKK